MTTASVDAASHSDWPLRELRSNEEARNFFDKASAHFKAIAHKRGSNSIERYHKSMSEERHFDFEPLHALDTKLNEALLAAALLGSPPVALAAWVGKEFFKEVANEMTGAVKEGIKDAGAYATLGCLFLIMRGGSAALNVGKSALKTALNDPRTKSYNIKDYPDGMRAVSVFPLQQTSSPGDWVGATLRIHSDGRLEMSIARVDMDDVRSTSYVSEVTSQNSPPPAPIGKQNIGKREANGTPTSGPNLQRTSSSSSDSEQRRRSRP